MATDEPVDPIEEGARHAGALAAAIEMFLLERMALEPAEIVCSALTFVHANTITRAIPDDAEIAVRFLRETLVPIMESQIRQAIETRKRAALGVVEKIGRMP
jgi:hypothetical protein